MCRTESCVSMGVRLCYAAKHIESEGSRNMSIQLWLLVGFSAMIAISGATALLVGWKLKQLVDAERAHSGTLLNILTNLNKGVEQMNSPSGGLVSLDQKLDQALGLMRVLQEGSSETRRAMQLTEERVRNDLQLQASRFDDLSTEHRLLSDSLGTHGQLLSGVSASIGVQTEELLGKIVETDVTQRVEAQSAMLVGQSATMATLAGMPAMLGEQALEIGKLAVRARAIEAQSAVVAKLGGMPAALGDQAKEIARLTEVPRILYRQSAALERLTGLPTALGEQATEIGKLADVPDTLKSQSNILANLDGVPAILGVQAVEMVRLATTLDTVKRDSEASAKLLGVPELLREQAMEIRKLTAAETSREQSVYDQLLEIQQTLLAVKEEADALEGPKGSVASGLVDRINGVLSVIGKTILVAGAIVGAGA